LDKILALFAQTTASYFSLKFDVNIAFDNTADFFAEKLAKIAKML
jgi:hypothetical protein